MEKNTKIILVIILIALAFYFGKNFGLYSIIIKYGEITFPPEQKTITWLGNNFNLFAPSFDALSCSNQKQFCGCSDGEITISNSYSSGDSLILTSSMNGQYTSCGGNYITTNLTLLKGRLYGKCTIYGSAPIQISSGESGGFCKISDLFYFGKIGNEFAWDKLGISEVNNNFSIILNEPTTLEIYLESASAAYGSGSSRMELRFDETICNTPADTNCNNIVDRNELGVYINSWIAGSVTRDSLGQAIVAWAGS